MQINEVFETIQGEASFTGTPSVFVRTQFCPVGCPWCDTKHTWALGAASRRTLEEVALKQTDSDHWCVVPPQYLMHALTKRFNARHLVLTGGEPMWQDDLGALTDIAIEMGWTVQIETSGTRWTPINHKAWVTLSPKINMPGGYEVLHDLVRRADEIKMPVGKMEDIDKLRSFLSDHRVDPKTKSIWLQPLSQSPKATALCVEQATKLGYRLSIQTHKFLGMR